MRRRMARHCVTTSMMTMMTMPTRTTTRTTSMSAPSASTHRRRAYRCAHRARGRRAFVVVAHSSSKVASIATVAMTMASTLAPCAALAAGFAVGGTGGGGAPEFGSDETVRAAYATADLAVDLASPLAAYWCVTKALRQDIPAWLNAVIFLAVLGATWVCVTGNTSLDAYLS